MKDLKKKKLVDKIGFSIYAPEELDKLYVDFHPDIIQAPFNIFDQRLETSGWLEKLHNSGVEVHIRSVFLQGLLLISAKDRPIEFKRWAYLWKILDKWLAEEGLTPLEACIGFANANEYISHIVVGVDSKSQLKQILEASDKVLDFFPSSIITTDQSLINPSNWTDL